MIIRQLPCNFLEIAECRQRVRLFIEVQLPELRKIFVIDAVPVEAAFLAEVDVLEAHRFPVLSEDILPASDFLLDRVTDVIGTGREHEKCKQNGKYCQYLLHLLIPHRMPAATVNVELCSGKDAYFWLLFKSVRARAYVNERETSHEPNS